MKTYLQCSIIGEITEIKTKHKIFNNDDFKEYLNIEYINYDKYIFVICKNKETQETQVSGNGFSNESHKKNITFLPFYSNEIYGNFLLFLVDNNNNIMSLTENKFLKFTSKKIQNSSSLNKIEDYSSDDFNLSD